MGWRAAISERHVLESLGLAITDWASQLSITVTKYLTESIHRGERFITAHSVGGFDP